MLKIFYISFLVFIVRAKVLLVTDQKLECCVKINKSSVNDVSELELIPENDTTTFINGTWKFTKPVEGPWPMHIFAEHYVQGQWLVQAYDRRYKNFCEALKNPVEPWYYATKDLQGCPIPAGTVWFFDMVPIKWSPSLLNAIPRHYMGRWRINYDGEYKDEDGTYKRDCYRGYGDAFVD